MFVFIVFESVEHITVSFCIKVNIEYNFEKLIRKSPAEEL